MVHPKTGLMNNKTGGCSGEHPYNLLVITMLKSTNSYIRRVIALIHVNGWASLAAVILSLQCQARMRDLNYTELWHR